MKEKTKIRHKNKEHIYCTETLDKEHWGGEYIHMTCYKCGFVQTIYIDLFLKWQYCDEVIKDATDPGNITNYIS